MSELLKYPITPEYSEQPNGLKSLDVADARFSYVTSFSGGAYDRIDLFDDSFSAEWTSDLDAYDSARLLELAVRPEEMGEVDLGLWVKGEYYDVTLDKWAISEVIDLVREAELTAWSVTCGAGKYYWHGDETGAVAGVETYNEAYNRWVQGWQRLTAQVDVYNRSAILKDHMPKQEM